MIRSKHWFSATFVMFLCLATSTASAGKYNTVLDIGDAAPAWSELPGTDDGVHALQQLAEKKVVVVAFTCNSCPYAVDAEDRLNALVDRYAGKSVAVVAINVNKVEEDRMAAMKQRAKEKGFKFAYLWDESQQIAKDYGAKYTPEFYVLDEQRKVVYMGAMDDSPAGDKVTKTYVIDAIEATLAGREVEVTETIPIGCRIRIERRRRTR
ncbi:thiol-disulfide oxidoreductase [Stieleria neptunia]|uniref:Thiol-disulfide oxidoreductase n=1 Tax=Stieleria neptunia TaxID=2527979 RepID=A0A518I0F8_9BACT|nr:thioredoxin family protein [Stieleria neptunia]QDV46579.1 thiol-disulfide oxidoreductase [Stieleria neptunia]